MCLAKAYTKKSGNKPIMEDITYMQLYENSIELETLFGKRKLIPGRVLEINFSTSIILLDQEYLTDKA